MNNENPAWKPFLDVLPPEFHNQVIPILKEWDKNVQGQFQAIHEEYKPYKVFKPFIDNNIDFGYAEQAVVLADQLQRDPATIVKQINEAWNLGFVSKDEVTKPSEDPDDFLGENTEVDIFKDPRVKAMQETLDKVQQEQKTLKEREEEERALAEFEEYLDGLESKCKEDNLPFHRDFVTALISQGVDGDEAVKQYHQILGSAADTTTTETANPPVGNPAPPVMGGDGSIGSGSESAAVDFGKLPRNDLNKTIEQMLSQAAQSGQG